MIDWDDNTRRKAFRVALQEVYPAASDLEIFVDEELNANLATVAGGDNLQVTSHGLLKWARAKGKLDAVYAAFKRENPQHPVITRLEQTDLKPIAANLTQDDWDDLFQHLSEGDLLELQRAFKLGFKTALGITWQQANPQHPRLTELQHVREQLEIYDVQTDDDKSKGPVLAVRFAECAIAELRRSDSTRDLSGVEAWVKQITERFKVPPPEPIAEPNTQRHAYLLITLEAIGADFNVYPELRLAGAAKPTKFQATPTTCAIDQVAGHISEWIRQAEIALEAEDCDDPEVTLELFLPRQHFDLDIATTWMVRDDDEDEIPLGTHRAFLVRSADRIRKRQVQRVLQERWQTFAACVEDQTVGARFHCATRLQGKGELLALLKDGNSLGLKFVAQLPTDPDKRSDVFKDIINAPIPVALWSASTGVANVEAEFDALLGAARLTNFRNLAQQWRTRRMEPTTKAAAKPIRLLCDRPDRWPRLPDPSQEEDLFVAP